MRKNQRIRKSFARHRLGITSVYGGGKGTVSGLLEKMGAYSIDYDLLARDIVKPGAPLLKEICEVFGKEMINNSGELNRAKIAEEVFANPNRLKILNALTHPHIIALAESIMQRELKNDSQRVFALNIPLLFEADLLDHVDWTVVVNTPEQLCIERGMKRDGLSEEQIKKRLQFQIPINEKIKQADYIIENNGSIRDLEEQVKDLWRMATMQL